MIVTSKSTMPRYKFGKMKFSDAPIPIRLRACTDFKFKSLGIIRLFELKIFTQSREGAHTFREPCKGNRIVRGYGKNYAIYAGPTGSASNTSSGRSGAFLATQVAL